MVDYVTLDANMTASTPLGNEVSTFNTLMQMLNTSLGTIMAFLTILCCQLIYSLMLSDVEDKTYQFGMLRALGFNRKNIVHIIILQSLIFSLLGIITGLAVAAGLNAGLRAVIFKLVNNTGSYMLSSISIWFGVTLGLVIPMISNIIPIKRALGKNLRSSLDLFHRQVNELSISAKTA